MRTTLKLVILIFVLSLTVYGNSNRVIEKEFEDISKIDIELSLGNCEVEKSNDGKIKVRVEYTYDEDEFENELMLRTLPNEKHIKRILRYEMRLDRQLSRTYKLLSQLQSREIPNDPCEQNLKSNDTNPFDCNGKPFTGLGDIPIVKPHSRHKDYDDFPPDK